jgi:2-polyprenyl-3-methyl-5-hydroxy-6-metoxy-1,4-benzoquinol methylase
MHKKDLKGLRNFYEEVAETKGDTDEYWAKGFHQSLLIEKIQMMINTTHTGRVIDVGCGDGRTVLFLKEHGNPVVGMDISYIRLSRAKQKLKKYHYNTLLVQSYAEFIPIKRGVFDGAICTEVLEHVLDDKVLLKELYDTLRPNGWVLISIPTVSLRRYFEMWYAKKPIYFDPTQHLREFSYYKIPWFENDFILIKDLEKKFITAGLEVIKRYGVGFELPLWVSKLKIGRALDKLFMNRKVNRFLSTLPILKTLCVYTIFILKKRA